MFKKLLKINIHNFSQAIKKKPMKIQNLLNDTNYLLSIKKTNYQESLVLILKGFYEKKEKEEILNGLEKQTNLDKKNTLLFFNSINNIYQYLEKSNYGFLSGDFQPSFLNYLKNLLEKEKYDLTEIAFKLFQSLDEVKMKLPIGGIEFPDIESQSSLFERELILENVSYETSLKKIVNINEQLVTYGMGINTAFASKLFQANFDGINELIKEDMNNSDNPLKSYHKYKKYFSVLSSETWSMIALVSAFDLLTERIMFFKTDRNDDDFQVLADLEYLNRSMGVYIFTKAFNEKIIENLNKELKFEVDYEEYKQKNIGKKFILNRKNFMQYRNKKKMYYSKTDTFNIIPEYEQNQIATVLTYFLKISFKNVNTDHLILNSTQLSTKTRTKNYIKIDPNFIKHYLKNINQSSNDFLQMDQAFPLIYPPAKWQDIHLGGYYLKPSIFMKYGQNHHQKKALEHSDLTRVFSISDFLSKQPWKIDKYVLSVVEKIWENGGGRGSIPYRYDKDVENLSNVKSLDFHIKESYGKKRVDFNKEIQKEYENNSSRAYFNLRMDVANAFKDCGKIYFPHNLDFRGRVYPIPPHLNHMGDDLSRSLLIFSKKKKLGKDGIKWLKIHLANKMGRDKLPLYEREAFVDDNLSMIEKWNEDPIKNDSWLELEDCWQSLGAMNEVLKALKCKDPSEFLSCMPVHQDGTCNGLQHYAAIGRDLEGAMEVNLVKMDKPGDVYTKVCKMVIKGIKDDLKEQKIKGSELLLAKKVLPLLKRKVVKQTVMTTVYGVTFIGAKDQIKKQLKEHFKDPEALSMASTFVAVRTLKAVSDLFSNAHQIKLFLTSCVDILNKNNQSMSWFTPLGLPISQPYRNEMTFKTDLNVLMEFKLNSNETENKIIKTKQKSAFAPNFIHSLDSTHLMMTAERMEKNGLTFASVHDSFWTHACDVEQMSLYLREEFINLYNMDLLGKMKYNLEMRFPGEKFPDVPKKGELNLNSVLGSEYFFS